MTRLTASERQGVFEAQIAANVAAWKAKRKQMGRPVKEWIGKTADTPIPDYVKERVRETWDDVCYLSERPIRGKPFDAEHVVRVRDGKAAANREGNLRPALADAHKDKSRAEMKAQALADRKKRAAAGTKAAPKKELKTAPAPVRPPQKKASTVEKGSKVAQLRALRESRFAND